MKKLISLTLLLSLLLLVFASCGDKKPAETTPEVTEETLTLALNLSELWDAKSDSSLVQGSLLVSKNFAASYPGVLNAFLEKYENSIDFMANTANLNAAAQHAVDAGILPNMKVALAAIPRCNLTYLDGAELKNAAESFFAALNIASPGEDAYYMPSSSAAIDEDMPIRIGYLAGTTGVGMAKLIADEAENGKYIFRKYSAPALIMADIANGTIDAACLPTNAFPKFYSQMNNSIQLAAINTLGVLYILANGVEITSIEDLAGKTVYVPEAAPKLVLQYLLDLYGVKNVTISMEYDLDTLPAMAASGAAPIALLPEPKVTVAFNLFNAGQS